MTTAAMEAVGSAEIKVTIRPDQELRAERAMGVSEDGADASLVFFYDTPMLKLFKAGAVLRARLHRDAATIQPSNSAR